MKKVIGTALFLLIAAILAGCGILGGPTNTAYIKPVSTPLRWYPPAATPTDPPTVTPPPQIPVSGISTPPLISVTIATNCRTGPSADYDILLAFFPGDTAQIIGKYTPTNYWVINTPNGYTCWLWGQNATTTGDTSTVPDYPVPALPASATAGLVTLPSDTPIAVPTNTSTPTNPPPTATPPPPPKKTPPPPKSPAPQPGPKPKPPKFKIPKFHFPGGGFGGG